LNDFFFLFFKEGDEGNISEKVHKLKAHHFLKNTAFDSLFMICFAFNFLQEYFLPMELFLKLDGKRNL